MADVVVLTLPLSDKTRHLIDEKAFSKFKDASVLVNISRGAVVDTNALINALENRIFGAVLDVFEEEPLNSSSPLWDMQNVIITPHNSFIGDGNKLRLYELILNNLWRYSK
jgi:phosphoglycerate dehydrogenase-like enzyme